MADLSRESPAEVSASDTLSSENRRPPTLLRQVLSEALEDEVGGEAAKTAYYFFLSFFPSILALFAFTGLLGGEPAFEWIMEVLRAALPGEASSYLARFVHEVTGERRPDMLSLGILLTLWAASNVFISLGEGLNRMYDLEESRTWWHQRAIGLVAIAAGLVLLLGSAVALLAGPEIVRGLGLPRVWNVLRWPIAFAMVTAMMALIYRLLPNRRGKRAAAPTAIGALVGSALWLGGTLAFRLYVAHFGGYSKTYGFVGGVIVLLLWLYLTAVAILLGGEVAATLEQRARSDWEVGRPPSGGSG